jgi:hypothetical protein
MYGVNACDSKSGCNESGILTHRGIGVRSRSSQDDGCAPGFGNFQGRWELSTERSKRGLNDRGDQENESKVGSRTAGGMVFTNFGHGISPQNRKSLKWTSYPRTLERDYTPAGTPVNSFEELQS